MLILLGWIDKQNHEELKELKRILEILPDKDDLFVDYYDYQISWESGLKDDSELFIRSLEVLYDKTKRPSPDLGKDAEKIFMLCDEWIEGFEKLSNTQDKQIEIAVKNYDNKNKYIEYKNDDGNKLLEYPDVQWSLELDDIQGMANIYHDKKIVFSIKQETVMFKQLLYLWKNVGKTIDFETLYKLAHDDDYHSKSQTAIKRRNIKRDFEKISSVIDKISGGFEISFSRGVALNLMW